MIQTGFRSPLNTIYLISSGKKKVLNRSGQKTWLQTCALRHVFALLHVVERLCLDRCPRWRCNHSLYSAGVSFTGTRWRNPVCVYLDQPDTVITVPEQHVKSDLRSVLHPDLHWGRSWSMRAHILMYIHTHCKADPVTYTFLWGLAFGQMSAELHVINYEQREREREIFMSPNQLLRLSWAVFLSM